MKNLTCAVAVFLALLVTPESRAQALCTLDDTPTTCGKKHLDSANKSASAAAAAANAAVADELSARNTGMAQAVDTGSASTFADFFSTFKAAADLGPGGEEDDDEAIGFEFSHCLRARTADSKFQCQGRLRVGGASLYEPLKQALPEATRDERAAELEKDLALGDSLTFGIFFNVVNDRFGRVPRFGTEKLFTDLHAYVQEEADEEMQLADSNTREFMALLQQNTAINEVRTFTPDTKFSVISAVNLDLGKKVLAAREADAKAEVDSLLKYRQHLVRARYFDLVDLVNNQAQINFGVEYAQRGELAGPDEWRAKLIWEGGFVNVKTANDYVYKGGCDETQISADLTPAAKAVECLAQYLGDPRTQSDLKNGSRYALSAEYVGRKKFSAVLPLDGIDFNQESEKSLIASAMYGRYLDFDDAGEPRSRVDVKGNYEDVRSDPLRQDRGTFVATYSQRVIGSTIVSVSLVYGTKPEFRGEVDEEISAHVGFNYKWGKSESF